MGDSEVGPARAGTTDFLDFLLARPEGSALPMRLAEPLEGASTVLAVHEDREHVRMLGEEPDMEVSSALLPEGSVNVVVLLLRFYCLSTIYEMWLNYHSPSARVEMQDLARQDKLFMSFFIDSKVPVRTIWWPNPVRTAMAEYIVRLEGEPLWAMSDFDTAKARVAARYPTVLALWDALHTVS